MILEILKIELREMFGADFKSHGVAHPDVLCYENHDDDLYLELRALPNSQQPFRIELWVGKVRGLDQVDLAATFHELEYTTAIACYIGARFDF